MTEDDWQNSIYALKYTLKDPLHSPSQVYMNTMGITDHYDVQYHHSMIDSDNVNDSIKVKILYNELMLLRDAWARTKSDLNDEIRILIDANKRLRDEIDSIKQALYFS